MTTHDQDIIIQPRPGEYIRHRGTPASDADIDGELYSNLVIEYGDGGFDCRIVKHRDGATKTFPPQEHWTEVLAWCRDNKDKGAFFVDRRKRRKPAA